MPKKSVKKKSIAKKKTTRKKRTTTRSTDKNIEKILVQNFVSLQEVMTDLSVKFDKLTKQISNLLDIFETSAENLAKKDLREVKQNQETEKVLEGIKELAEQNKVIAKGLTLMHDQGNHMEPAEAPENPPFPEPNQRQTKEIEGYKKSISSKLKKLKPLRRG